MSTNENISNYLNSLEFRKNPNYLGNFKFKFVKGPWQEIEDLKLIKWINTHGTKDWNSCANYIEGRTGKQCRERWLYSLNPNCKKGDWTNEEDYLIFKLVKKFGSKWSIIAKYIKGRNENSLKNRFYSTLRSTATRLLKNDNSIQESNLALNYNFSYNKRLSSTYLLNFFEKTYTEKTSVLDDKLSLAGFDCDEVIDIDLLNNVLYCNDQNKHAFNNISQLNDTTNKNYNFEAEVIKKNLLSESIPEFVNKISIYFNSSEKENDKSSAICKDTEDIQYNKNIDNLLAQLNTLEDKLYNTKEEIIKTNIFN
jgi:hypothetical protein